MNTSIDFLRGSLLCLLACAGLQHRLSAEDGRSIQVSDSFLVTSGKASLVSLKTVPFIESEYSKRFHFDSFENPKLQELREKYQLSQVVASGKDEFEKQVLLNDWTHRQFLKFGTPSTNCHGALRILNAITEGHTFYCAHYEEVLVSAAASLGWVDRPIALRRHKGVAKVGGSTEHSVTEMWSNQYAKWVMFDPTSNLHLEREGVPLNAFEIRQEWFYRSGSNLVFVVGKEQRHYRKNDLPIMLGHFEGFGDLAFHPDELDKYGFTGYIPNTDLMDSGYDYGQMFIVKDALCNGTSWHVRKVPEHPETDPYFPIGQASVHLSASSGEVHVSLRTLTPNFKGYSVRMNGGPWSPSEQDFVWRMQPGQNRLEAKSINRFGVEGPTSSAAIVVE